MNKRLPLSAGTVLQSRYTIVGQLGHCGMGAVYEAKDNRISASVALKETYADDDYTRNAFEREAKMLANMSHEAFPRVMDYFAEGDGFYLVMELIRGKDLSELLEERNAPFETEQVLEWADQILDALEDLHSQDIVHRDIKPSNLKLTPRGRIKLLDFGIAKGAAGDMTALQSTVGSMAAATLQYAPLEQVLRADTNWLQMLCVNFSDKTLGILDHGTDARSDLYALAATLYHLLTNTLPVNAPTRALLIWTGQADKLRPAREINQKVSPAFSTVLQKALEIDRNKRLKSASEMRELLREVSNKKDEIIVYVDDTPTPPLPILPVFQHPELQGVETESLDDKIPVDLFNADDKPEEDKTVAADAEKTVPLPIQSVFQKPKPQEAKTEILDRDISIGSGRVFDRPEQETVVRVLPSNINSKRRKIYAGTIIGIFSLFPISVGLLFLLNGSPSTKTGDSIEFVKIPSGSFMMGSPASEKYSNDYERPQHRVMINYEFYMSKSLVSGYKSNRFNWLEIESFEFSKPYCLSS